MQQKPVSYTCLARHPHLCHLCFCFFLFFVFSKAPVPPQISHRCCHFTSSPLSTALSPVQMNRHTLPELSFPWALPRGVTLQTGFYRFLQGSTRVCIRPPGSTRVHRGLQGATRVRSIASRPSGVQGPQGSTGVCRGGVQGCTGGVQGVYRGCTAVLGIGYCVPTTTLGPPRNTGRGQPGTV